MTTETALTLPERASVALGSKDGIRREIDAYLDKMPDDELLEVLQFVKAEAMKEAA